MQVLSQDSVNAAKYSGIVSSLTTIYKEEGIAGWYHGFAPAVCSVAVFWTLHFPCYDYAKQRIAEASGMPTTSPLVHMGAAAGAGLITDVITNPLWVVRTRLATQALLAEPQPPPAWRNATVAMKASSSSSGSSGSSGGSSSVKPPAAAAAAAAHAEPQYKSMRHAVSRIMAEEGPMAFFAGLSASILGLSHIMIQFPLYEYVKEELAMRRAKVAFSSRPSFSRGSATQQEAILRQHRHTQPGDQQPPISDIILASASTKLVASTITYPHEVIRARLQFDQGGRLYGGLVDATRKTIAQDGMSGLWLGFRLNIVRTIPQCVVTFTIYEYLSRTFQRALGVTDAGAASTDLSHAQRVARLGSSGKCASNLQHPLLYVV